MKVTVMTEENEILNRLMKPEARQAFLSGGHSGYCPRCGGYGECEESDGGMDEGWYLYSYSCEDCDTCWDEYFEFEPKPTEIYITEIPQMRESSEDGYSSWRKQMELDEVEEMVESVLAEEG